MKKPYISDDRTTREQAWEEGYVEGINDAIKAVESLIYNKANSVQDKEYNDCLRLVIQELKNLYEN